MRLLIACVLSILIISLWQYFYVDPIIAQQKEREKLNLVYKNEQTEIVEPYKFEERSEVLSVNYPKIEIENSYVKGSINLKGARIDDLILSRYKKEIDDNSGDIELLSPSSTPKAYFVEFGWLNASNSHIELPNKETVWRATKEKISANEKVVLKWANAQKVEFIIELSLDDKYMFDVKQKVKNDSAFEVALSSYAVISKVHDKIDNNTVVHEGGIGVLNDKLQEYSYSDLSDEGELKYGKTNWLGFCDKYWLTAFIVKQQSQYNSKFMHAKRNQVDRFQAGITSHPFYVMPNATHEQDLKLFAGAKEIEILDKYAEEFDIPLFDRAVDFGILYLITKPTLKLLHYFYNIFGNFGIAILILTVFIKLLLYPLAKKGFLGMNRLKELQPKIALLKERLGDDPVAFQREMIQLYKRENVNPVSGCLPLLLQIPVFFALYKVLYVSIEMRHAPFIWWIKDLSAPDTTNIFNLFGLLPWDPPSFMMIGVLPILMALSMYFQQRLSPEPTDPMQAQMMRWLPVFLLFMFASFPSGLIIYWTWSNVLSILQQMLLKNSDSKKSRAIKDK